MNTTHGGSGSAASSSTSTSFSEQALAYSVGFSILILFVLLIVSYISYKCNRAWSSAHRTIAYTTNSPHHGHGAASFSLHDAHSIAIPEDGGRGGGMDEEAIGNYPKFLYSQARLVVQQGGGRPVNVTASGCSICLADYKDSDMLRLLPECGHLFHLRCIDPWLKLHPTCPLCRSSPMPTPLAEVVPLSIHPN